MSRTEASTGTEACPRGPEDDSPDPASPCPSVAGRIVFSAKDAEVPTPGTCNYDLVGKCDPAKGILGAHWAHLGRSAEVSWLHAGRLLGTRSLPPPPRWVRAHPLSIKYILKKNRERRSRRSRSPKPMTGGQ